MLLGSYLMSCLLSFVGALATFLGGLAAPFTAAAAFTRLISLGSGTVGSGATALRLTAAFDFDAILAAILGGLGISLSLFTSLVLRTCLSGASAPLPLYPVTCHPPIRAE